MPDIIIDPIDVDAKLRILTAAPTGGEAGAVVYVASMPGGGSSTEIQGAAAIDAAIAGNPLLGGGRASTAQPSAVSDDGDAQAIWLDRQGAQYMALVDGRSADKRLTIAADSDTPSPTNGMVVSGCEDGTTIRHLRLRSGGEIVPGGPVAIDDPLAGFPPIPIGGRASTAVPSVTADDDLVNIWLTRAGALHTTPEAQNQGGYAPYRNDDVDESEDQVAATATTIGWYYIANQSTATRYVHFYNALAASVTVGTTVPDLTITIPGNASDAVAANQAMPIPIEFDTALTVAATTDLNGSAAPGANDIVMALAIKS